MNQLVKYPLIEALGLVLVWLLLAYLATPLALRELIAGLNGRYLADLGGQHDAAARQAMWLSAHAAFAWGMLALALFISLNLGRYALAPGLIVCANLLVWALAAHALNPETDGRRWLWLAGGALLSTPWAARHGIHRQPRQTAGNPCLASGLLLFAGIGWLTLLDYSARGHFKFRFLANGQFDAICLGLAACCLMAGVKPSLFAWATRLMARIDGIAHEKAGVWRRHMPLVLLLTLNLLWSAGLVQLFGRSAPALTSELLRVPAYLMGAWLICRWGDAPGHWVRATVLGLSAVGAIATGLLGTDDKGQLLLVGLSGAALCGSVVALLCRKWKYATGLGIVVGLAGLVAVNQLLLVFGGDWSARFAARLFAMRHEFTGTLQFLSELRWFSHGTPALTGHGLGRVPWCGTLASLEASDACGIAKQIQSDYFYLALYGAHGAVASGALVGAMALWLVAMLPAKPTDAHQLFAYWVVAIFVTITLTQLFYTCLGAMGAVVLTGITFPIMAFGKTSFIVSAALIGLSLNKDA
ncbi:hypothetical protein [Massilia glaciei]|uniref:O-antigen ligase domain-containing protein n=1 Tax=Massilia glaciei TaxID=1524097 RepID=A0A2U2HNH9_9BURK|nr:hypothetical protein [Massilia glaciei]PWF49057.1 hypothetical protein C7C56_008620 [Massilia glaciei]